MLHSEFLFRLKHCSLTWLSSCWSLLKLGCGCLRAGYTSLVLGKAQEASFRQRQAPHATNTSSNSTKISHYDVFTISYSTLPCFHDTFFWQGIVWWIDIVCLYCIYTHVSLSTTRKMFLRARPESQDTCLKQLDRAVSEVPWQTGSCFLVSFLVPCWFGYNSPPWIYVCYLILLVVFICHL